MAYLTRPESYLTESEEWCIRKTREAGVPGSEVLGLGKVNSYAYMIQSFVPGRNEKDIGGEKAFIWQTIGAYAKKIHEVTGEGFGERLGGLDKFDDSWERYLKYNFENSLRENDSNFINFLDGYGLSRDEFNLLKPDIISLALLRSVDKLRWAIDKKPKKIEEFSKRLRNMLLMHETKVSDLSKIIAA